MNVETKIVCPICLEGMDVTDQHLQPCKCGYEICLWCWHHIMDTAEKGGMEATCPACLSPYDKEKIMQKTISSKRLEELNAEKRLKQQKSKSKGFESRAHLGSCRVIRRNVVYLAGLPVNIAEQKILQKKEFLGQYGKVLKVVMSLMTKANRGSQQILSTNSCCVFVTFSKDEEAVRCIQALDGFVFYGSLLRASFGASKFCEAWLKNMPCENPHCVYMHDAGRQEDICTKTDLMSVCASKVRQSSGIPFDNTQRLSGKFFPPPVQSFCSNKARNNSVIVNPMLCHHIPYESERSICLDGCDTKCGVNFDEASRSSKVSSIISSSVSTPTIQGTKVNKPTLRNCLPCSGGVLGNSSPVNFWQRNRLLSVGHSRPTVEINSVRESSTNESTYVHKRAGEPLYASCGPFQQSISMDGDMNYSSLGDTGASLLNPLNSTNSYLASIFVGGQTVACRLSNYSPFLEATSSCLETSSSDSQDILSNYQQYTFLGSESMRSTDNLEAKNTFPSESENRKLSASYEKSDNHIMGNEASSYKPSSIIGPKSSGAYQNLSDMSSVHKKNACISDKVRRDATEEKIISDILSLDLDLDDDLGKLLGIEDETVCSNILSSWKSRNNNVSKFCFATVDNSVKATKQKFLLSSDECKYDVNLNKLEMLKDYPVCNIESFRNLTISDDVFSEGTASLCHCPNEHATVSKPRSTLRQSASPPLLPQSTPASRLTLMNRPMNFRPHDFFPRFSATEYRNVPMLSESDSSALSQHAGNSLHSSHSQQVAAEKCCNIWPC